MSESFAARWHIVTGKGGVGKTSIAIALALALTQVDKRVLLAEIEERQGLARALSVPPLGYDERELRPGLHAIAIDPQAALLYYLERYFALGRAARALKRFGAIEFATTIAPGLRDVLTVGKLTEAVERTHNGKPVYDAIVLDAPPTGRIGPVLGAAKEVAE